MATYGQFCPVAMAAEVLTERWTPLIIRELLCGSTRFTDLRRGVPLMSPSLLSKRLETLCRVGVVARAGGEYRLTPAGEELRPIIERMGVFLDGSSDRKSHFWLVLNEGRADLCLTDPGHEIDLHVRGHVRTMIDYWMGRCEFAAAVRRGGLTVSGPSELVRGLPAWFARSDFAPVDLP